jgi:hypothetical protein
MSVIDAAGSHIVTLAVHFKDSYGSVCLTSVHARPHRRPRGVFRGPFHSTQGQLKQRSAVMEPVLADLLGCTEGGSPIRGTNTPLKSMAKKAKSARNEALECYRYSCC